MCFNKKFVYNKTLRRSILVNCGICEACLQEKANRRKLRLLNHVPNGYDIFFFHLTYAPEYLPYFYLEDICPENETIVDVYRSMDVDSYYNRKYKKVLNTFSYGERKVYDFFYDNVTYNEIDRLQIVDGNKVGVLVYSDIQKFFKRLRSRLKRDKYVAPYLEKSQLYYFCTGEYGEEFSRPHWHLLLYVPKCKGIKWWKRTVSSCWPYARGWLTRKNFEYAISPQKYISQYVNCSVDVSRFLLRGKIRPTWHYSHGFGSFNPCFQLDFILTQIRKKEIEYTQIYPLKGGNVFTVSLPIPTYITNRFFPKFKGLCKIPFHELPIFIKSFPYKCSVARSKGLDYSDCRKIHNQLVSCYQRYHKLCGRFLDDYIIDFINLLKARFKNQIRKQLELTTEMEIIQSYDNIKLYHDCKLHVLKMMFPLWYNSEYIVDANLFKENQLRTNKLLDDYSKYVKQKQLSVCLKS